MAHGRSYWELPAELLAQVHTPLIETKRQWDPETSATGDPAADQAAGGIDEQRRKREEVLAAMAQQEAQKTGAGSTMDALQMRMAQAAQRRTADEVKRSSSSQPQQPAEADAAQQDGYLAMVRQLQDVDKDAGASGGKWLVR